MDVTYTIPEGMDSDVCDMIATGALLEAFSTYGMYKDKEANFADTILLDNIYTPEGNGYRDSGLGEAVKKGRELAKDAIENFNKDNKKAMQSAAKLITVNALIKHYKDNPEKLNKIADNFEKHIDSTNNIKAAENERNVTNEVQPLLSEDEPTFSMN